MQKGLTVCSEMEGIEKEAARTFAGKDKHLCSICDSNRLPQGYKTAKLSCSVMKDCDC